MFDVPAKNSLRCDRQDKHSADQHNGQNSSGPIAHKSSNGA